MKAKLYGFHGDELTIDFEVPNVDAFRGLVSLRPERIRVGRDLIAMSFGRTGLWRADGSLRAYGGDAFVRADILANTGMIVAVGTNEGTPWLGFLEPSTLARSSSVTIRPHPGCALSDVVVHEGASLCAVVWRGQTEWGFDIHRLPSLERVPELTFLTARAEPSPADFSPNGALLVTTFAAREGWWLDREHRDDSLTGESGGGTFTVGYVRFDSLDGGESRSIVVRATVPAGYRPDDEDAYLSHRIWGPYPSDEECFELRLPGGVFEKIRFDQASDLTFELERPASSSAAGARSIAEPVSSPTPITIVEAIRTKPESSPRQLDAMLESLEALPVSARAAPWKMKPSGIHLYGAARDAYGRGRLEDARTLLESYLEVESAPFVVSPREGPVTLRIAGAIVTTDGQPFDAFVTDGTKWVELFHLSIAMRRRDIVDALVEFPIERFEVKKFPQPERFHAAVGRSFVRDGSDFGELAKSADSIYAEASQKPRGARVVAPGWHALRGLVALHDGDAHQFELELIETLRAYHVYRATDFATSPLGRFCIPAIGLACLGAERGVQFRVASDYMPTWLYDRR